jgi:hypothetical protein
LKRGTPGLDDRLPVALNVGQYGGGCSGTAHCGEKLTITFGDTSGKLSSDPVRRPLIEIPTVVATVADCCPGCGYGDLDMTRGLFNRFADASACVQAFRANRRR